MEAHEPGHPIFALKKPWSDDNNNPIWLASTVKLQRNIEKHKFPCKLDVERKKQIIALSARELQALEPLTGASLLKGEELDSLEKEYLVEHFLSSSNFHQVTSGEAFLIDKSGKLMVLFNMCDHLSFLAIDNSGDLEGTWNDIVKIETHLGKSVSYSFSQKFGFLTSDPAKCGTALTVAVYLQLSGLIHSEKIDASLEAYADESVMVTGIQGNPTEIVGDVVVIQNNYTLGVTEESVLSSMRSLTTKLVAEEKAARSDIAQSHDPVIMDKVSRAFAVLLHSYQIEAVEALNSISILKLGIDVGWIAGITSDELNQLFFNCRRAHLLGRLNGKIGHAEVPHKRAEFIHQSLKEAKLLI